MLAMNSRRLMTCPISRRLHPIILGCAWAATFATLEWQLRLPGLPCRVAAFKFFEDVSRAPLAEEWIVSASTSILIEAETDFATAT